MTFTAILRTLLAGVSSRARVYGLLAVGVIGVVVAVVLSNSPHGSSVRETAATLVDAYGLTLLIPVAALVFGTASMGDPIEDGTYVYLWLRPIRRGQISMAAYVVTLGLVIPLAVVPTVAAAAVLDHSSPMIMAAAASSLMAAVAYSAVFVLLGQVTQRALVWGIGYLLIFEEFICRGGKSLGFVSVHSHAVSMLSHTAHVPMTLAKFSRPTSVAMTIAITLLVLGASVRRQSSMTVA